MILFNLGIIFPLRNISRSIYPSRTGGDIRLFAIFCFSSSAMSSWWPRDICWCVFLACLGWTYAGFPPLQSVSVKLSPTLSPCLWCVDKSAYSTHRAQHSAQPETQQTGWLSPLPPPSLLQSPVPASWKLQALQPRTPTTWPLQPWTPIPGPSSPGPPPPGPSSPDPHHRAPSEPLQRLRASPQSWAGPATSPLVSTMCVKRGCCIHGTGLLASLPLKLQNWCFTQLLDHFSQVSSGQFE